MNIEELRTYCLSKPGVTECFPFDEYALVFKVGGKMFLFTGLNEAFTINVKCDPEKAIELRENHIQVIPGYHMNKKHWNTILIDDLLSTKLIYEWIDHSYNLVYNSLSNNSKNEIKNKGL